MPVMNGLQATRIIRSFEETGSWEAAEKAGIELNVPSSEGLQNSQSVTRSANRIPIIAVSNFIYILLDCFNCLCNDAKAYYYPLHHHHLSRSI